MKQNLLVYFFLLIQLYGFGQDPIDPRRQEMLDHLQNLENEKNDELRIKSLLVICQKMRLFDLDSARTFCLESVALSKSLGKDSFQLLSLEALGVVYKRSNQLKELIINSEEGIRLSKKMNNSQTEANFLLDMGFAYERQSQANKAAQIWLEALDIARKYNNPTQIGIALISLGNGYYYQSAYDKALDYYQQAYDHYSNPEDQFWRHTAAINMAECYRSLNQTSRGIKLTQDAIQYFDLEENAQMLYHALHNRAEYLLEFKITDSLSAALMRLDSLAENPPNKEKQARVAILWARKMLLTKESDMLNMYSTRALNLARSLDDKNLLSEALKIRIEALELDEEWKKVIPLIKEYQYLKDSMASAQTKIAYDELNLRYETEQKDLLLAEQSLHIQTQKNNQKLLIYLVIFIGFISGALILFLRQRQISARVALQNAEKQLMIESLSAVIQGEEQERTRIARELHDGVGGMLSSARMKFSSVKPEIAGSKFEEALHLLDLTSTEIRRTAQNLMPEVLNRYGLEAAIKEFIGQLRTNKSVEILFQTYHVPLDLPKEMELNVYRIVQELVHNACKHAGATEILVQLSGSIDSLEVSVEDNGSGMKEATQKKTGLGLQTVANRVQWLGAKWDMKSEATKGVSHQIDIPLKNMMS